MVQALLAALTAKAPNAEVKGLIQELRDAEPGIPKPAQSSAFSGNWELLWDYSTKEAPALQKAVLGLTKAFQQATLQNGNGKITNVAQFPLGWSIRTLAQCTPEAPDRSAIQFDEFFVRAGPFRCAALTDRGRPLTLVGFQMIQAHLVALPLRSHTQPCSACVAEACSRLMQPVVQVDTAIQA